MTEITVNQRVKEIIKKKNISSKRLAYLNNVSEKSISNWLAGRQVFPYTFFQKLKNYNPEISLDWIFTGEGEMEFGRKFNDQGNVDEYGKIRVTASLERKLEEQDNMIAYLKMQVSELKARVEELESK